MMTEWPWVSPSRAASQLGVFARRDGLLRFPIELFQLLQHDCSRGHIDAKGECFCGKDHPQQFSSKKLLDHFFKHR